MSPLKEEGQIGTGSREGGVREWEGWGVRIGKWLLGHHMWAHNDSRGRLIRCPSWHGPSFPELTGCEDTAAPKQRLLSLCPDFVVVSCGGGSRDPWRVRKGLAEERSRGRYRIAVPQFLIERRVWSVWASEELGRDSRG